MNRPLHPFAAAVAQTARVGMEIVSGASVSATDFQSANAAPFDHALASITFNQLAKEREVFAALNDSLEIIANQLRNAPGKIWSDQGSELRDSLANHVSDMQGEIAGHLRLIEEAESGRV